MGIVDSLRRLGQNIGADKISPGALPPGGRSSHDSSRSIVGGLNAYLAYWDWVEPMIPPAYLDQIIRISVVNPDMSQALSNWVALGNPGHDLIITGNDDAVARAGRRLHEKARSLASHTAGIDGLINKYLEQVALSGAISSEDVVTLGANPGVSQVVIVPASQIRFRRESGEYVPYQVVDGDEYRLSPLTYRYFAHTTLENSPYATPPMLAALEPILDQRLMKENLQFIIKKFGLFGLISAAVTPPGREARETAEEYRHRVEEHLKGVLEAFKENFHEGLAVFTDDIKVERTNITSDTRGIQDIFRLNEEQIFSGLGSDPAMHGRTYSTTETYARVVYNLLMRHVEGYQRPVKRRIERTYQLDLALAGIPVDGVRVQFHRAKSQNPLDDARADEIAWRVASDKVKQGLINPDEAARELGYSEWYEPGDPDLAARGELAMADDKGTRVCLRYDRSRHEYQAHRQSLTALTTDQPASDLAPTNIEDWLETGQRSQAVTDTIIEEESR